MAEDPGLMHRVKKVAFRTRLQSGMSHRVYNHHFFTRNNSCLDLKRQCRTKVDERESGMSPTVLPQFPSTGPTLMPCPRWYTRSAFPVPTASFSPFGTPEDTPQLFSTGTETKFWEQVGIYCLKFAGQHKVLLVKPTISIIYTQRNQR